MACFQQLSCSVGMSVRAPAIVAAIFPMIVSGQIHSAKPHSIELRLRADQIVNGVPDTISFVFENVGDHEVRIPPLSPCVGQYSGTLKLRLAFSPFGPHGSGKGGGCGGGTSHPPTILDQVKSWKRLEPGQSLTVAYKRTDLFVFEQGAGDYDFSGEYDPPHLTEQDISTLEHAGIDFLHESLTSAHLRFNRRE